MARIDLEHFAASIPKGRKNAASVTSIAEAAIVSTVTAKKFLQRFEKDGHIKSEVVETEGRGRNPVCFYRTKNVPKKYLNEL